MYSYAVCGLLRCHDDAWFLGDELTNFNIENAAYFTQIHLPIERTINLSL